MCITDSLYRNDLFYRIETINLGFTGNSDNSDWIKYPDRFSNIISAMSKCSLKESIQRINVWKCGDMNKQMVQQVLLDNGMQHVKVIDSLLGSFFS